VLNLSYFYNSTFRSMCAVPNMAVFWSSLTSWFPGMLLTYFLNDFEIVPVISIIIGTTFVFIFHMRCISIVRSLCFSIFLISFLITFLSPEIATSINIHVLFSLSRIIITGLLLGIVLSVCTCWFHNMVTLLPWLLSTDSATCSYQCFCPIVPLFPCICWSVVVHTLYLVFLCTVLSPVLGINILYYFYYYYLAFTFFITQSNRCHLTLFWSLQKPDTKE